MLLKLLIFDLLATSVIVSIEIAQDFGWGPIAGFTIFFGLITLAIPVLRLSGARWPLSVVFSVVWALIVADATHDFLLRIEYTLLASIAAAIACITVHRVMANE